MPPTNGILERAVEQLQGKARQAPKLKKKRRLPAASLPAQETHETGFPPPLKRQKLAQRLAAGRELGPLLQLAQVSLLHKATDVPLGKDLLPNMGLTATAESGEVFILSTFTWRGKDRCIVVPLLEKTGTQGATHTFNKEQAHACLAKDLTNARLKYRLSHVLRGRPWLRVIAPHESDDKSTLDISRKFLQTLDVNPAMVTDNVAEHSSPQHRLQVFLRDRGVILVEPQAAIEHAKACGHRVGPRELLVSAQTRRASVVWDLPWPIELDLRLLGSLVFFKCMAYASLK